jgi:hypothetical protein
MSTWSLIGGVVYLAPGDWSPIGVQHDTYASHASPRTPSVCFLWAVPVYGNLSRVTNRVRQILLLPRKSALDSTSQFG